MANSLEPHLNKIIFRELSRRHNQLQITGVSSLFPLAQALCHTESLKALQSSHLVVTPNEDDAKRFIDFLKFVDPHMPYSYLPPWDTSFFSELEPSPTITKQRISFLSSAKDSPYHHIFITTAASLSEPTLPFSIFTQSCIKLKPNLDLAPDFYNHLLNLGYSEAPLVEDHGRFARRGGAGNIFDIASPQYPNPLRIELFGDQIESIRFFDFQTQLSEKMTQPEVIIVPCRETIYQDDKLGELVTQLKRIQASDEIIRAASRKQIFSGIEYYLPLFYDKPTSVLDHFSCPLTLWLYHPNEIYINDESVLTQLVKDKTQSPLGLAQLDPSLFYIPFSQSIKHPFDTIIELSSIDFDELSSQTEESIKIKYPAHPATELVPKNRAASMGTPQWVEIIRSKFSSWIDNGFFILVAIRNHTQLQRLSILLEPTEFPIHTINETQDSVYLFDLKSDHINLVHRFIPESVVLPQQKIILLKDEDFFGKKIGRSTSQTDVQAFEQKADLLAFSDLKVGDLVVHTKHGIGIFDGLKKMKVGEHDAEFVQINYKDNDKLYLPVTRLNQLQRYSGPSAHLPILDRLGGQSWEKTKLKVKNSLRDLASELLNLYAQRAMATRPAYASHNERINQFELAFQYEETEDQLRAIKEVSSDLFSNKPMDRLICADVGFGKTEIAMRAAFIAADSGKQVAFICPTTVLSFQHFESLKQRFKDWEIQIDQFNRFTSPPDAKRILQDVTSGKAQIIVGTHRLLSQDVQFKNLGLVIIDEEQKFGVTHKEKLKKFRAHVDTLTLSATPIPRTLNLSLMGVRDLSFINTPPTDRLPTRTFVTKWNDELIKKSILSEIQRGGQIYFIHNRVQSLYELAQDLKRLLPEDCRIGVAHGQLPEHELEDIMIRFFHHELDVLVCTAIVESGMDVPRANTMFIDLPHLLGLSQLYQLRGRVGRSKERAYCYLLLPKNRELDENAAQRLKIIKENSALGSGIRIAQYDLELRGSGNILGDEQSGHINTVGYELYMDLLTQTIDELRGSPTSHKPIDCEVNLKIQALIPDQYISDIRIRLAYYKALSQVTSENDFDILEAELSDQFGPPPQAVINLLGISLIRWHASQFGVLDISQGLKNITLTFSAQTPLTPDNAIKLAMRSNKKYQLLPNNRLVIRMNEITWPRVYEELNLLIKQS